MIDFSTDPIQLVRLYNGYAYGPAPEELAERLQTVPGVQADIISQGREILYAHFDLLDDQGKTVLAQFANYAVRSGWGGDNAEGRCEKILAAAMRELGEPGDWPDPEEDPAPRAALREGGKDWRLPDEPEASAETPPPPKG